MIWIVDCDPNAAALYSRSLEGKYAIRHVDSFAALRKYSRTTYPASAQLLIADVSEANGSLGNDFASAVSAIPTLIVSALEDKKLIHRYLDLGAVDFVMKPVRPFELLVKVERVFARSSEVNFSPEEFCLKGTDGRRIDLTVKEFQIYTLLSKVGGAGLGRDEIEKQIWPQTKISPKAFDVHLFNLRRKLVNLNIEIRFSLPNRYSMARTCGDSRELSQGT